MGKSEKVFNLILIQKIAQQDQEKEKKASNGFRLKDIYIHKATCGSVRLSV